MMNKKIFYIFFFLLIIFGIFLRVYKLNDIIISGNELQYTEGAKGLVETGHFEKWSFTDNKTITPFKKDKILTVQIAAAYKLFGLSEFSTRLPSIFWGVCLLIFIPLFVKRLSADDFIAIAILFFIVFSEPFIKISRIAAPEIMYFSWLFIALFLFTIRNKVVKIIGAIIFLLAIINIVLLTKIDIIAITDIFVKSGNLAKLVFTDFRILWLMYIPIILYLIKEKWWQKRKELILIIISVILYLSALIIFDISSVNIWLLILLLVIWLLSLISVKSFIQNKKRSIFILLVLIIGMTPAFPSIASFPPITKKIFIDEQLKTEDKNNIIKLYKYLDDYQLDIAHIYYPNNYYLKDYSFDYIRHFHQKKLKIKSIIEYLNKNKTGYLVYPKIIEKSTPGVLQRRIMKCFNRHNEISELTKYQVFSWDESQKECFMNNNENSL